MTGRWLRTNEQDRQIPLWNISRAREAANSSIDTVWVTGASTATS